MIYTEEVLNPECQISSLPVACVFHVCMDIQYMCVHAQVEYMIACGCACKCSHASAVREDQCVRIDVVLPSAREVNGGGGGGGEVWEESGLRGEH